MNKLFKVSCLSKCGSYFGSYLQSVTVVAKNEEEANKKVSEWLEVEGRSFIESDPKKWSVFVVSETLSGVVDYHEDSDY